MFPFEDEDDELARDDYGLALRPGEFRLEDGAAPGELLPYNKGLPSSSRVDYLPRELALVVHPVEAVPLFQADMLAASFT